MSPRASAGPEAVARERIDTALSEAGWMVQDYATMNPTAANGVAVREFPLERDHGDADYLLFVDGQAVGVLEAKKAGDTLTGVETQAERYAAGLPVKLRVPVRPLAFNYLSNGYQTLFFNLLDPHPRSRRIALNDEIPHIHRPETLAAWLSAPSLRDALRPETVVEGSPEVMAILDSPASQRPSTLRGRLQAQPTLVTAGLRSAQITAIRNYTLPLLHACGGKQHQYMFGARVQHEHIVNTQGATYSLVPFTKWMKC